MKTPHSLQINHKGGHDNDTQHDGDRVYRARHGHIAMAFGGKDRAQSGDGGKSDKYKNLSDFHIKRQIMVEYPCQNGRYEVTVEHDTGYAPQTAAA